MSLLEKATGLFFGLGTSMILWRGLEKEDMAAWVVFMLVTSTLEMGRSGLIQNGLMRHLGLHGQEPAEYNAITRAALTLNLGFSVASTLILVLLLPWLLPVWKATRLAVVFPVYFVTNFVMALFYQCNFVQQANFEFRGIFWSNFLFRGSLFTWALCCRLLDWPFDLVWLVTSMLFGAVAGGLVSFYFARPFLPRWRVWADWTDWAKVHSWILKLVGYGKYTLGTNLSTMLFKSIDKLALGHLIGPVAFVEYDVASKVTQLVEVPSFSMAAVVFPQGAERLQSEGKEGVKRLYERSVGAVLGIILPFIVVVLLFAEPIVRIIAGWKYAGPGSMESESAELLRITAFFGMFMPFAVQFGTILDSTGRPAVNFLYTALTAVLNLGLSYFFVSQIGIFGAALATLTAYSISFVFAQLLLRRDFGINPLNAFRYIPVFYRSLWMMLTRRLQQRLRPQKLSSTEP